MKSPLPSIAGLLLLAAAFLGGYGCGPAIEAHHGPHLERHRHPHCHGDSEELCHEHRHGAGHH